MSYRDGLPKSYDAWRTQGPPEQDHSEDCPMHDDAPQYCVCGCPFDGHNSSDCSDCEAVELSEPECRCSEILGDALADRAEAQIDRILEENN